jgi:hypothetical protein
MNTTLAAGSSAQSLIAAMITPALLILASGSLIATSLARLGRIVDRIRKAAEGEALLLSAAELDRERLRADYANRAITILFVAVTLFVIAGIAIAVDRLSGGHTEWLPVTITLIGMLLIVAAGITMAAESHLSSLQLVEEIERLRQRIPK